MISVDLEVFTFLYICSGVSLIFGLWWYYDHRDRVWYEPERARVIFHCVRCGNLYTARRATEVAPCDACGFKNPRLRF